MATMRKLAVITHGVFIVVCCCVRPGRLLTELCRLCPAYRRYVTSKPGSELSESFLFKPRVSWVSVERTHLVSERYCCCCCCLLAASAAVVVVVVYTAWSSNSGWRRPELISRVRASLIDAAPPRGACVDVNRICRSAVHMNRLRRRFTTLWLR